MFSKKWLKSTLERALKTAAQSLTISVAFDQAGRIAADWADIGAFVLACTLLSIATSIISTPIGPSKDDPSLI